MKTMKSYFKIFFISLLVLTFAISLNSYSQVKIFNDQEFLFQFLRTIGYTYSGGADIKECLLVASKIKDGDPESWYNEWYNMSKQTEDFADESLSRGFKESAKESYLKASNYYRNTGFFLHINPNDERDLIIYRKSRDCFQKAVKLMDGLAQPIKIPFENTTLPGYFCLVDKTKKKRPLLIIHSGFDGTAEEEYFEIVVLALKRGYNCIIFDGPGQGGVIREQNIVFRPNWGSVISPVIDFACKQPQIDKNKIGLIGISFGGYLAPRAAAFEKRLKACVANGGVYDFYKAMLTEWPANTEDILKDPKATEEFDKYVLEGTKKNPRYSWGINHGMIVFGVKTPSEYLRGLKSYTLEGIVDKITCNMLVIDSEDDKFFAGQPQKLYDLLKCPKELLVFKASEGAELHCQAGAKTVSSQKILNWLDKVLGNK